MPFKRLLISSFTGPGCAGNLHTVDIFPGGLPAQPQQAGTRGILVEIHPVDSHSATVRFSQAGRIIRRCGSGVLAAAHALCRELGLEQCRVLQTRWQSIAFTATNLGFSFTAPSLRLREGIKLQLAQNLFDRAPHSLCAAGGASDYLIAEFESAKQVRALQINPDIVTGRSRRALIATAASDLPGYDYVLRYFAPQYGVAEDAATGSANLMLAHYWQNKLNKSRVVGLQVSNAGGVFFVEAATGLHPANRMAPRLQKLEGQTRLEQSQAT